MSKPAKVYRVGDVVRLFSMTMGYGLGDATPDDVETARVNLGLAEGPARRELDVPGRGVAAGR